MKHTHFYATKEDILPVLGTVESGGSLKYVEMTNSLSPNFQVIANGASIPTLGIAQTDSSSSCPSYVVTETSWPIKVETVTGTTGVIRYCIDQIYNPDSVVFKPAGTWGEEFVLSGSVGTASDSAISLALMKRFNSAIRKHFVKVRAFWVGPKALELLYDGKRLASAAQSPREFDLKPLS